MKLDYKKTIFVGFAFFLICAFWQVYDTIIPITLTNKFGLSQTASGVVMSLDNVIAVVLLPLFGALSDRYHSKHGKRTPFIFVGTIVSVVLFVALSFVDNMQLTEMKTVVLDNEYTAAEGAERDALVAQNQAALQTLYHFDTTIVDPAYEKPSLGDWVKGVFDSDRRISLREVFTVSEAHRIRISDVFTEEQFTAITMKETVGQEVVSTADYLNYVVPLRQAYAAYVTASNPVTLVFFMVLLLLTLIAMATFRSPAVALMPDVTIKPLRSRANAVINLMGALGGIIILLLCKALKTDATEQALMNYTFIFSLVGVVMLASLGIFLWRVKEPRFVAEMEADSRRLGIEEEAPAETGEKRRLSRSERRSLLLILASVVLWFMGYNAISSKYSVYATLVLDMEYILPLLIAQGSSIIAFVPIGILSSKWGRKKSILTGIVVLALACLGASFLRAGDPAIIMNVLFVMAGIGWATINVNSFPMVVELSRGGDVGKYTGYYYTASMSAQILTPILSGILLDINLRSLFPYAVFFIAAAFFTMLLVRHGDAKPLPKASLLENFDVGD
ncbi:MAG: MFS transporter [Eubacteriales bacterium]